MGPTQMSLENLKSANQTIQSAIDASVNTGADYSIMALVFGVIATLILGLAVRDKQRDENLNGNAKPEAYYVKIQNRVFMGGALYTLATVVSLVYFLVANPNNLVAEQQPAIALAKSIVAQAEKTTPDSISVDTSEQAVEVLKKAATLLSLTQDVITPAAFEETLKNENISTDIQSLSSLEAKVQMAIDKREDIALFASIAGFVAFASVLGFLSYAIRNKKFGLHEYHWVDGIRIAALFIVVLATGALTPVGPEQDKSYLKTVMSDEELKSYEVAATFAQARSTHLEANDMSATHVLSVVSGLRVRFSTENLIALDSPAFELNNRVPANGLVSVVNAWKKDQS